MSTRFNIPFFENMNFWSSISFFRYMILKRIYINIGLFFYFIFECETIIYECNFDDSNIATACNDYNLTEIINENNKSNESYIKIIESYTESLFTITDYSSISKIFYLY